MFPAPKVPRYTLVTLPAAANHLGAVVYVSDGYNGGPSLATSDGTTWFHAPLDNAGLTLETFAVAGLPAAASHTRRLVHCSNGASGNPCLAFSNGANWLQVALGSAVAAA